MVVLNNPMSVFKNVGRVENIKTLATSICINGKVLTENNGVATINIICSSQVLSIWGRSESKPQTCHGLEKGDFIFLANNKEYSKG